MHTHASPAHSPTNTEERAREGEGEERLQVAEVPSEGRRDEEGGEAETQRAKREELESRERSRGRGTERERESLDVPAERERKRYMQHYRSLWLQAPQLFFLKRTGCRLQCVASEGPLRKKLRRSSRSRSRTRRPPADALPRARGFSQHGAYAVASVRASLSVSAELLRIC